MTVRLLAVSHTGLWSGAERVLLRAATTAAQRGWDVTVACPRGPFLDRLSDEGLRVVRIPELKLPSGPRPLAMARLILRWRRTAPLLRRLGTGSDVVLVNGLLGLPAMRFAKVQAPVVWLVHDSIHRSAWRTLLSFVAGTVDLAIPVSEAITPSLRQAGIAIEVVHNGTDWPVEPASDPEEPPVIGCAALLTEWKGQAVLLEAAARMRHRDAVVELVGGRFPKSADAEYADALDRRARQPDLQGRVRMTGFVDDPAALMRRWTVSVSPSIEPEACPLAVLEAMSLGLAVVGTDHGGTPEVLGSAGVVVAPRDPDALAAALDGLLDDSTVRSMLGRAARVRVEDHFTLAGQTSRLLDVIEQQAASPR